MTRPTRRMPALAVALLALAGCGGPSPAELENRKAFETLLTAISLKSSKELEKDARRFHERHAAGFLSEARHREIDEIIGAARSGDWGKAEAMAYAFRVENPYFR